jgi:hypothetical protein
MKSKKGINLSAFLSDLLQLKIGQYGKINIPELVPNKSYRNKDRVHTVLAF